MVVRGKAVECLSMLSDDDVYDFLPQLVQVIEVKRHFHKSLKMWHTRIAPRNSPMCAIEYLYFCGHPLPTSILLAIL